MASNHRAIAPNHVAVITGAADGIGRAAAERFARLGMHVLMADIEEAKLAEAQEGALGACIDGEQRILCRAVDVSDFGAVSALKDQAYAAFGHVDVLMNNAGTSGKTSGFDHLDQWRRIIGVNLWGVVHGMQAFAQAMIDQSTPAVIINTGSKQGITNPPGNPAYNVSKSGVRTATEALQHELRNIADCQVSAHLLVPGFTYTGLIRRHVSERPAGAWLPEEVIDYLLDALARDSFYIICPDNEVSSHEDRRRVLWGAGDIAEDRPPLSRWHADYGEAYSRFVG